MKNKIKDSNTSCSDAQRSTRSVKAKPALVPLKGGSEAQLSKSHSHLQASPRKTFKKVYEQKHLVRNTKDQYSAVCDKVWQKSHQRLKIQLDGGMSKPAVPEAKLPLGDLITAKTAFGKATTFDFFDLYAVKKTPSSNNRYMLLGSGTMLPLGSAASLLSYTPSCSDEDKDAKDPNTLRSNAQHSKASPKIKDFQVSNTSCSDAQRSGSLTSSIVVKWKRKNTAKLSNVGSWNALEGQVEDSLRQIEGRTVVNIASDKYYKRIKIKTLKEMIG